MDIFTLLEGKLDEMASVQSLIENKLLQQYLQNTSQITINTNICKDTHDYLVSTLNELNQLICTDDKKYMLLFDDTYCEGVYYVFYISERGYIEEWTDNQIERLV